MKTNQAKGAPYGQTTGTALPIGVANLFHNTGGGQAIQGEPMNADNLGQPVLMDGESGEGAEGEGPQVGVPMSMAAEDTQF